MTAALLTQVIGACTMRGWVTEVEAQSDQRFRLRVRVSGIEGKCVAVVSGWHTGTVQVQGPAEPASRVREALKGAGL